MSFIEVKNFSFSYDENNIINDLSFNANEGEFVLLSGKSGCGKTTFLKHFKSILRPFGKISGRIFVDNKDILSADYEENQSEIAYIDQSYDNQIVTDYVWHDLAFPLENSGLSNNEIKRRVSETASFFGIENLFRRKTNALSGGEKQILNLASFMTLHPKLIILDEPLSELSPISRERLINIIVKINKELGVTIIMAEHYIDDILPYVNKMVYIDADKEKEFIGDIDNLHLSDMDERLFSIQGILFKKFLNDNRFCNLVKDYTFPRDINAGRKIIRKCNDNLLDLRKNNNDGNVEEENVNKKSANKNNANRKNNIENNKEKILNICDAWFSYEDEHILKGLNLSVTKNEIYFILGDNGTGKSTLLKCIAGINSISAGTIKKHGKISMMPQNPEILFTKETVKEEIETLNYQTKSDVDKNRILEIFDLKDKLDVHPYDLSGGEKQKLGILLLLLCDADILLLDEPSKGLDNISKEMLGKLFLYLKSINKTLIIVSHDIEFCVNFGDKCALLFDGELVGEDEVKNFFNNNNFYTTKATRLTKNIINNLVTLDDICDYFGLEKNTNNDFIYHDKNGENFIYNDKNGKNFIYNDKNGNDKLNDNSDENKKIFYYDMYGKKLNLIMDLLIFVIIPLTIYFGYAVLKDEKYFFISLLVLFEGLIPPFILFEKSKLTVREIVLIAIIIAFCVAGRMAFYMFPQFKPVAAIVILSGAYLGKNNGFIIGSITMFVSNIIFAHGPWTPWQMFAMGLVGYLAGLIFMNKKYNGNVYLQMITGFVLVTFVYGVIMNFSTLLLSHIEVNKKTICSYLLTGFPLDVIHAFSTIIFILLLSKYFYKRLNRIKTRYLIPARKIT
ncbi:ECF-type riboflavin transporter, S component [Lachnospiraceae bacterium RM5]|nr:ECF-type riboflavin transporter, S component [Lachnospiraceae bacterium RM5]